MACNWKKICVLLTAFWKKNPDVSFGWNSIQLLQHCVLWWLTLYAAPYSCWLHMLWGYLLNARKIPSARWVLLCQSPVRSWVKAHPVLCHILLCATMLDIISTSYACALSLQRALSPPPHAAQLPSAAATGHSTVWQCTSQWVPHHATACSCWLHIVWQLLVKREKLSLIAGSIQIFAILLGLSSQIMHHQIKVAFFQLSVWSTCSGAVLIPSCLILRQRVGIGQEFIIFLKKTWHLKPVF